MVCEHQRNSGIIYIMILFHNYDNIIVCGLIGALKAKIKECCCQWWRNSIDTRKEKTGAGAKQSSR